MLLRMVSFWAFLGLMCLVQLAEASRIYLNGSLHVRCSAFPLGATKLISPASSIEFVMMPDCLTAAQSWMDTGRLPCVTDRVC